METLAQWQASLVPATQEAEAGRSPRSLREAWEDPDMEGKRKKGSKYGHS
jgi:hypothetical protein